MRTWLALILAAALLLALHGGALQISSSSSSPHAGRNMLVVRRRALQQKLRRRAEAAGEQLRMTNAAGPLTRAEILGRVPIGRPAFFTVANAAYADLAINWALLLLPLLREDGMEGHGFIAALDDSLASKCVARSLPTLRVGLGGSDKGLNASGTANFRLKFSAFRAYGVTKADLIAWLIGSGRPVVVSDVDCAWLASPSYLLDQLPEADVLAGTDCLDTHEDDDRLRRRAQVVSRCGHHLGSHWGAWFNTGVLGFRATPNAISIANEWKARMASITGVPGENNWSVRGNDARHIPQQAARPPLPPPPPSSPLTHARISSFLAACTWSAAITAAQTPWMTS